MTGFDFKFQVELGYDILLRTYSNQCGCANQHHAKSFGHAISDCCHEKGMQQLQERLTILVFLMKKV